MVWGLSIVSGENETLAYYWRDGEAALARLSVNQDFFNELEKGLKDIAAKIGVKEIKRLFQGEGLVRLSTSYLLHCVRQRSGQKVGVILNKNALNDLSEEEKRGLPLLHDNVVFISESVKNNGEIEQEIIEDEVIKAYRDLLKVGVHSVVISLRNSSKFPENERKIKELLAANYPGRFLGGVPVYISSDFELDFGSRGVKSLTIINAYVQAAMRKHLFDLEQKLKSMGYQGGLFICNRFGGLSRWDKTRAIDTADSVLRSAISGAEISASKLNKKNVLVYYVDAYSTSFGFVHDGVVSVAQTGKVLGAIIGAPSAEAGNVPVGVRSKVKVDFGRITFENDSGEGITVKDVEKILGYTGEEKDEALVGRFKQVVADPLGKEVQEAALDARRSFVSMLSAEISDYVSENQLDLSGYDLLPANGEAECYCWSLADSIKIPRVLCSSQGEYLSGIGLASLDMRHFYQTGAYISLDSDFNIVDADHFMELVHDGVKRVGRDMAMEGLEGKAELELKLLTQIDIEEPIEIALTLDDAADSSIASVPDRLREFLKDRVQDSAKGKEKEIKIIGVSLLASLPCANSLKSPILVKTAFEKRGLKKNAHWEAVGTLETPFYDFSDVKEKGGVKGPAIIGSNYSYYLVPPEKEIKFLDDLNAILEVR